MTPPAGARESHESREADLLRAIDEDPDPDDPAPYLVYADFLLQQGDLRGELIQVQLQLESLAADDPSRWSVARREVELLDLLAPAWDELDATYRFRRGFLVSAPAHLTSIRFIGPQRDLPPDLLDAFLLRFGPHAVSY